ncbi:uncharacterized protein LOC134727669 [Mytilus trossulus]|uniref:uncharacterized protein LOC134727669 n=1 Tax=Mytilus trossulus TaxID=6551 RepID=UPI0030065D07
MTSNNLSRIPTPEELGFVDVISTFIIAFSYALQFGNNPWKCDCSIGLYIKYVENAARKFKGITRHNVTCFSPPQLKGYVIGSSKENNAGTAWAIHTLNVYLEQHGMKTCIPYRDFEPGGIQVEQIYKNIIRSRFYIVALTEDYQESQFQNIEWNHIWSSFKCEIEKLFPSWKHIAVLIQLIIQSFSENNITVPEHFQWLEKSVASASTLYCPNCCKGKCSDFEFVSKNDALSLCCAEFAEPFWNFPKYSCLQTKLQIVNYDTLKKPQIRQHEKSNSSNYFILDYHGKCPLLYFPYNICKYPDLVTVNLSDNNIQNLPNISCLSNLDTLDLSNNSIENINSSTFSKLTFLRYLDLSNNLISYIEPESFNYRPGSLMYIKIKRNGLKSFDITNIFLGFWFFEVDCTENKISKFTNEVKGKRFRKGELIGGGYIRMTSNNLSRIPTPEELGFVDVISTFIIAFSYALQFGNNPWKCDCSIGLYIKYVENAARKFKGITRHNVTCFSPPQLKGYVIGSSKGNSSIYDLFICNINMKNKCPMRCTCFQQPSKERVVVNCTFSKQTKLPSNVPDFDNLDIDFSRNQIKYVQFEEYLNRTKRIDLSYNDIIHIDPLIYKIKTLNYINLYKNRISFFDKTILQKNPCNLVFGEIKTKCRCELYWIKTWLNAIVVKIAAQIASPVI